MWVIRFESNNLALTILELRSVVSFCGIVAVQFLCLNIMQNGEINIYTSLCVSHLVQ